MAPLFFLHKEPLKNVNKKNNIIKLMYFVSSNKYFNWIKYFQVLIEDQDVTFRLVKGSGPIHLSGSHQTETTHVGEDEMDDSMAEEEEEEDIEEEELQQPPVSLNLVFLIFKVLKNKLQVMIYYCR